MAANYYKKKRNGKVQFYVRYRENPKENWISCGSVANETEANALVTRINYAELENDQEKLMELIGTKKLNQEVRKESVLANNLAKFNMTFKQLKTEYVNIKKAAGMSGTTIRSYEQALANPQIAKPLDDMKISEVSTEFITDLMLKLKGSNTTKQNYLRYVRYCFNHAIEMGYIYKNPFKKFHNFELNYKNLEYTIWSPEQLQSFLKFVNANDPRWLAPIVLAATTGMRKSEIIGLHYEDFDHVNKTVTIRRSVTVFTQGKFLISKPKTVTSARTVYLDNYTYRVIMNHVVEQDKRLKRDYRVEPTMQTPLFCGSGPEYIKPSRLQDNHKRLQQKFADDTDLRLPVTKFKDLRDTWATHALESGQIEEIVIAKRMGHKNPNITRSKYQHITNRVLGTEIEPVAQYQLGDLKLDTKAWDQKELSG